MRPSRELMVLLAALFVALGATRPDPAAAQTPVAASLTPADRGWVQRVQDTLNAITTLKARFLQIAPDGRTTQGTAWLDRPGRMRFEYAKPSPLLLVAGGGKLVFNDSELKQTTDVPLDKTPVGLLLRANLTLSGDVTVTAFHHAGGQLQITLVRTASPGDGSLTLIFSDQPLALRSWSVLDAQGRETRVDLYDARLGQPLPQTLFDTSIGEQGG
ncbi:LolA family protein [Lichenicoccus sp.]|uniref:LolA family protein n=1 Tax=Lichenicoccus sp. TaxID=2781899 RepID=UPI003D0EE92B